MINCFQVLHSISLRPYIKKVVRALSERMAAGGSVGECVRLIEENLIEHV